MTLGDVCLTDWKSFFQTDSMYIPHFIKIISCITVIIPKKGLYSHKNSIGFCSMDVTYKF